MKTGPMNAKSRLSVAIALTAAVIVGSAGAASASTYSWNITFTDGYYGSSALTLTTTTTTNGFFFNGTANGYDALSVSGHIGGDLITGLGKDSVTNATIPTGNTPLNDGFTYFDNILYASGTTVDSNYGLELIGSGGTPRFYNLSYYGTDSSYYIEDNGANSGGVDVSTFSAINDIPAPPSIPEPASVALLMIGVAGVGMFIRRKAPSAG